MEDLLTGSEQVHVVAEAVNMTKPDNNDIDLFIYKRIICSDQESEHEGQIGGKKISAPEMDEFIFNMNSELKKRKSKSLTAIREL